MNLVERYEPKKLVDTISAEDAEILKRYWLGHDLIDSQAKRMQKFLSSSHEKHWIACDCLGPAPTNVPVLAIQRWDGGERKDARYGMRRLKPRGSHARDCVFAFDSQDEDEYAYLDRDMPDGVGSADLMPNFLSTRDAQKVTTGPKDKTADGLAKVAKRQHPLARRLFWLIHHAKLNARPCQAQSDVDALLSLADTTPLVNDLTLKDVMFCTPKAWNEQWMKSAFLKCKRNDLKQRAWWLATVTAIDPEAKTITVNGVQEPIAVVGKLSVFGGDARPGRFPMLMMAEVVPDANGKPELAKAYCHPIVDRQWWCLVDSNYERQALKDISAFVANPANASGGTTLSMIKPLFDWNATGTRPDFVVCAAGNHGIAYLVIETMGLDDADYRERKERTLGKLADFDVLIDDRTVNPTCTTLPGALNKWFENGGLI